MGVAEDADIWMFVLQERSSFFRQFPTFIQNMTDGDTAARQFDHSLVGKSTLFVAIYVAGDGGDWSDLLQLFDHGPIADIPGGRM